MEKVTVLIAVYNAERFLSQCLDSLLVQTMPDFQAVCVDDASTDRSWEILQDYANKDSRIEIVHLNLNCGQAHARNVALRRARGTYTCFLDSDDWFSPDALQCAVETFSQEPETDCVLFHTIFCNADGSMRGEYPMKPFHDLSGYDAFRASLTWDIHGIYMIRTSIHRLYQFDDSVRSFSDDNTTRIHYLKSRYVSTCAGTYYYRQHEASVSHQQGVKRFDYLKANTSMKDQLIAMEMPNDILDTYENVRWLNCIGLYYYYYQNRKNLTTVERRYGLGEIQKIWQSIEVQRLLKDNSRKLGYFPLQFSWKLFRIQEETYFFLRNIKDHLIKQNKL